MASTVIEDNCKTWMIVVGKERLGTLRQQNPWLCQVLLPAVLLVRAEISLIRLALAEQAGHVAPEGSLASLQIQRSLFFLPILPPSQSLCLAPAFVEICGFSIILLLCVWLCCLTRPILLCVCWATAWLCMLGLVCARSSLVSLFCN